MCDLQKFVTDLNEAILNFRLDLCCFVFSVKAGILLCGYFNVISNMVCLIAVSTGVFPPLMMGAQLSFMDGEYIKSTCAFAYSSDLCLGVLLLCAMYRKDIVLLRYYTYCGLAMLASTVLVYSMVIGILSVLHTFLLVISLTYQVYLILLVRSEMVELKDEAERLEKVQHYYYPDYPIYWKRDIEAPYGLETHEEYNVVSRRDSEIIPTAERLKRTENGTVEDSNEPNTTKSNTGTVLPRVTEVKDIKPKATEVPRVTEVKDIKPKATEVPKVTEVKDIKPKATEVRDVTKPTSERVIDQPTTSKVLKNDTKPATPEQSKALRFPYKFIAIKIPKEETIKEEKENEEQDKEVVKEVEIKEEINKDADKDAITKEESKEAKAVKKQKLSIFGRKTKRKSEDEKAKDEEKKD